MQKIILTFDLEFWHNGQFLKNNLPENRENLKDITTESTLPLLALLKKKNIKATFFVLGRVAEKHPEIVRKIYNEGHEIACHGYSHKILDELRPEEFEEEIKRSTNLLQNITGKKPIGFRAPNFSLNDKTKWALNILKNYGFKYDSSIFPFKAKLSGDAGKILELPVTGGGFYFRLMPLWLFKILLKLARVKQPLILYFHPHEFYPFIPDIKLPFWKKKIKYFGVSRSLQKLEKLLNDFEFISIENFLNLKNTESGYNFS